MGDSGGMWLEVSYPGDGMPRFKMADPYGVGGGYGGGVVALVLDRAWCHRVAVRCIGRTAAEAAVLGAAAAERLNVSDDPHYLPLEEAA